MKEKTKIFVLLFCGILFSYILFKSYHFDDIFQIFFYVILGGIGLYIFYNAIFDNVKKYKETKKLESYKLTIIGTFLVLLNLEIFSYYETKINSKSILKTEYGNIIADFKTDKNYIIKIGSWASKKYFYGTYSINDSVIILDKKCKNRDEISDRLLIRKYKNEIEKSENLKYKTYLIGIDKNGNEITNSELIVIEDNRK
ncbi:hypothetical protein [Flavobacterium sp. GP15]|uniref:hypothetical protein n=1 Tax=Flavobacterium sp. GP15 TaxID=2758567 RepID=UPI00165DB9FF|nr:hypothetical protein [Flavobacterium sp. GP15]